MPPLPRIPEDENEALLAGDRDSFELENTSNSHRKEPTWSAPSNNVRGSTLFWALGVLAFVGLSDVLALTYMSRIVNTVYRDVSTNDLEFANPYIGLDELYASGTVKPSKIDPIMNTPRIVAQVFADRPSAPAPIGEHDLFNKAFGTLSPHEKHLHIDRNTRSIAQFRTIDYGMEDCSLILHLPGPADKLEGPEPFHFRPESHIDVFRLDAPKALDVRQLSFRARPRVAEKTSTVVARVGAEIEVARFPCKWASLHAFEFACAAGSDCLVDVWTTQNTTFGVYMYQHQTV